jgi:hypothetical protein
MRTTILTLSLLAFATIPSMSQTSEERREKIATKEAAPPSPEAAERKARTMARLKKEGVHVMDGLPVIEDAKGAKTRTADEIAQRAIAVCLTAVKGEGLEQDAIDSLVKEYDAAKFFTPKELAFIKNPKPTKEERIQFSWRYECYWVLLWSLGYVDSLSRPEDICDVSKAVGILKDKGAAQFRKGAKLRPLAEILDQSDLIYRYHWAVDDARVNKKAAPAKLEGGVVQERHYVLNWLIGYMGQDWDDVTTDT